MSDTTAIQWADATFNPWEGCTKVSPGCANCYAEARNLRFSKGANWGKGKPRRRTSAPTWRNPVKWNDDASVNETLRDGIGYEPAPRPRVFPSLCDWLDAESPIGWLADFLKLIHDTPNLDWLLLTKRPENFADRIWEAWKHVQKNGPSVLYHWLLDWHGDSKALKPPQNVWIGTSVEDQQRADERIPELLKIPARVRFLSVEPMLGPVNLHRVADGCGFTFDSLSTKHGIALNETRIDWVIVGGESGAKARPCNVEWIRWIVAQCKAAGVPCFVKQLGSRPLANDTFKGTGKPKDCSNLIKDPKGGDPSEWPECLRVREFPSIGQ